MSSNHAATRGRQARVRYQVLSGKRVVALRDGDTASEALLDYVRSLGCREDELARLGSDAISWRGAIFRVKPLSSEEVEGLRPPIS